MSIVLSEPMGYTLHPAMRAAIAPLVAPRREYANWTVLDADGKRLWMVYADSREMAMERYGRGAADARLADDSPEDQALCRAATRAWGRLD
jgi:hypothetical protein